MKVGLLKIGKSTYFDDADMKMIGADMEVKTFLRIMPQFVEQIHFWGAYKMGTAPTFAPNVRMHDQDMFTNGSDDNYERLMQSVVNARPDVLFVVCGPHGHNNRSWQSFERYVYPVMHIVNNYRVPWVYFYSDPRYMVRMYELSRAPNYILCQYPLEGQVRTIGGQRVVMKYDYCDTAAFGRIGQQKVDYPISEREKVLRVIGNSKPGHWQWFERAMPALAEAGYPFEVWGIWPESPDGDPRWSQTSMRAGWDTLTQTKYLLCIGTSSPLEKQWPFTQRYYEMASTDAVVFVTEKYDAFGQRIPQNAFVRVKDGQDLAVKMRILDHNPDFHEQIVAWQRSLFVPAHEREDYLGGQWLYYMQQALANPTRFAFDGSLLKPKIGISHREVNKDPVRMKGKTLVHNPAVNVASKRYYLLVARALKTYGKIDFDQAVWLLSQDAYYKNPDKKDRDPLRHAAMVFDLLNQRGMTLVDTAPETWVDIDYARVIEEAPPFVELDLSKRSRGASRGGKKTRTLTQVQAGPGVELPDDTQEGVDAPLREARPRREVAPRRETACDRLVSTVAVNPFRPGSATHTHFEAVLRSGEEGITRAELAQWIEESNSQGVQTGLRLANWSFSLFPKREVARITKDA
jgi:hypothetical protein